jgi:hypothetical protein
MDNIQALADHMIITGQMQKAHLEIAKQLIELKHNVKITSIEFEDGSGKSFNITTTGWEPKQHVRL